MKQFRVTFYIQGHGRSTVIFARYKEEAIALCREQYPEATSINASEVK
jgi:hypothetical protein